RIDWTWRYLKGLNHADLLTIPEAHLFVRAVAFHPDGRRLISGGGRPFTGQEQGTVKIWDAATGKLLRTLDHQGHFVTAVARHRAGGRRAAASSDGRMPIWDAPAGRARATGRTPSEHLEGLSFPPDGTRLASVCQQGTVRVWDPAKGREEPPLDNR